MIYGIIMLALGIFLLVFLSYCIGGGDAGEGESLVGVVGCVLIIVSILVMTSYSRNLGRAEGVARVGSERVISTTDYVEDGVTKNFVKFAGVDDEVYFICLPDSIRMK